MWDEGEYLCESYGMKFASFNSKGEAIKFRDSAGPYVWVGIYKDRYGAWSRQGGGELFINWGKDKPNGVGKCAQTKPNYGYGNYGCDGKTKIGCILEESWRN